MQHNCLFLILMQILLNDVQTMTFPKCGFFISRAKKYILCMCCPPLLTAKMSTSHN
jgi:hypothetical protein